MNQVSNDQAVEVVAELLKDLDADNPDVGMAPPWRSFVNTALKLLDLTPGDVSPEVYGR